MARKSDKEFSLREGLAFCFAMIGVQLSSEFITQWGTYFYSPTPGSGRVIYIGIGLVGIIFVVGRVFDVVTDPLVGVWSDKTSNRPTVWRILPIRGRRRPFIFWGSILMAATSIAFWYPPVARESPKNLIFACVIICVHWGFFTVCAVPLYALAPEIARSNQARVKLGTWVGVGTILGVALADGLSGELISRFDPARRQTAPVEVATAVSADSEAIITPEAEAPAGAFSPVGYQRVAMLFTVVSLCAFQFFVWGVRERYQQHGHVAASSPVGEILGALQNRLFLHYFLIFLAFNIGYLAAQRALPFWAEVGLGGDEGTVTRLLGPFVVGCLLAAAVMPALSKRVSVKWLMVIGLFLMTFSLPWMYAIGRADLPSNTKVLLGACLFAFAGLGQGIMYILPVPLLGAIIDLDEQRSGRRREAIFNAWHNITWKGGLALSVFVATLSMRWFGNSADNPLGVLLVGPLGGLFGLIALIGALFYPVLHVASETPREEPKNS